jgi:hypothetical protein
MTESFEHYASKYYDPVKAHEYYMKTRQTLNDEGKQAKAYITKRIREERYSVLKKEQSNRNQKIYSSSVEMANQIHQLQLQMKQLTPEKKKTLGKQIQRKIAGLREDNARAKADFQKKYIEFAQKTRSDYSKTLDSEINKLYSDASMTKAVQTKKKSRTKK